MIAFLQPLALLGLAAAAIPTLIHFMGRKLPPVVSFPALRYLSETERVHSRRLKLRNLLLLILRTAVIVFLILAASRPVARVAIGSSHNPTALALVLDNSLSSGAVVGGQRVLDVLIERGKRILDRLGEDDWLWVVLADGLPRRVTPLALLGILDSVSPSPIRLDVGQAVRAAARVVADAPLVGHEVVVVSDLQESALSAGEEPVSKVLAWLPPELPANRGIDSARPEPPVWSSDGTVVAAVSGSDGSPVSVGLTVAGQDVARLVAAPGDRVVLSSEGVARGWSVARVQLDPDEFRGDDVYWLAVRVADPAAATAMSGAGRFVREALEVLQSAGRVNEGDRILLSDRLEGRQSILFPPDDPALVGAINRSLRARGVRWRLGDRIDGEWQMSGSVGVAVGSTVYRRHRLEGSGSVFVTASGEPWLVRAEDVVIVASRMEESWTDLPVTSAFVPFLDLLINRIASEQAWTVSASSGEAVTLPGEADAVLTGSASVPVPSDRRFTAPLDPGVYFLVGEGGDTVGALEVNHDARESILRPASRSAVRAALGPGAALLDDRGMDRELFSGARRADLASLFLAAAILTALVELVVATAGSRPSAVE